MQHVSVEAQARPARGGAIVVADLMTPQVHSCRVGDTLERAARLMWEHDCGALPVVDAHGRTVGMVTDRDVCMAAYIQGRPLSRIPVTVAASHRVHFVRPDATLDLACAIMREHRVRRLPVIDVGGNLVGMLSLVDVVRVARRPLESGDPLDVDAIAAVLTDVFRPSRPLER
jgi:CBS domain-containing protein